MSSLLTFIYLRLTLKFQRETNTDLKTVDSTFQGSKKSRVSSKLYPFIEITVVNCLFAPSGPTSVMTESFAISKESLTVLNYLDVLCTSVTLPRCCLVTLLLRVRVFVVHQHLDTLRPIIVQLTLASTSDKYQFSLLNIFEISNSQQEELHSLIYKLNMLDQSLISVLLQSTSSGAFENLLCSLTTLTKS